MSSPGQAVRTDAQLLATNRQFYDALWRDARLIEPERFNTWALLGPLAERSRRRLEVAPGLRPRLPIAGTHFVDISAPALAPLKARGGRVALGSITALPFATGAFGLVCALDIIEHVDDEDAAMAELARVTAPGGAVILATPLHPSRWTAFDDWVGHRRRYEPERIVAKLAQHALSISQSAAFGMQPRSSRLLDLGMWWLTHHRECAMWWYNRVIMPVAVRFEKNLVLREGMIDAAGIDEVLLVCRREGAQGKAAQGRMT